MAGGGGVGVLRWSEGGEETASIGYQMQGDALLLVYETKDDHGNAVPTDGVEALCATLSEARSTAR